MKIKVKEIRSSTYMPGGWDVDISVEPEGVEGRVSLLPLSHGEYDPIKGVPRRWGYSVFSWMSEGLGHFVYRSWRNRRHVEAEIEDTVSAAIQGSIVSPSPVPEDYQWVGLIRRVLETIDPSRDPL